MFANSYFSSADMDKPLGEIALSIKDSFDAINFEFIEKEVLLNLLLY